MHIVFQTETGGTLDFPIPTSVPAVSGYADVVDRWHTAYRMHGTVVSGLLSVPKALFSQISSTGEYILLPQVVDTTGAVYFLTPADVQLSAVPSIVTDYAPSGVRTLEARITSLEQATTAPDLTGYYTAAQVDALLSAYTLTTHAHTYAPITHLHTVTEIDGLADWLSASLVAGVGVTLTSNVGGTVTIAAVTPAHTHVNTEVTFNTPVTLTDTARVWDDIRIEPTVRATGSFVPVFEKWIDDGAGSIGLYLYSFTNAAAGGEKEMYFTLQMPHSWDGTDISVHIHWMPKTTGAGVVRWGLEYAWANIGSVFPSSTVLYTASIDPVVSTLTAREMYLSAFTPLVPTVNQNQASSILIGRIFRNSAHASDTYTDTAGLLYMDAHYRMNKLGAATF
jgi:hypothetical protein